MTTLKRLTHYASFTLFLLIFGISCSSQKDEVRVLVFSKTAGFRHKSIETGIEAIIKLGEKHHFTVDTTENSANFNEENLKRYKAVIFLSTTGDVFDQQQQNDFERFIQAGGGYVGIHAASDTEYDWPWYGKLVGGYFDSHPPVQRAAFIVVDKNHPATDSLPDRWEREDEFYNYKKMNPDINVLIKIDESTYKGGKHGDDHPMSWYHEYDGGRAFYTNMGHTDETFSEPLFLKHLWGGIQYALGDQPAKLNYSKVHTKRVPEENRFTKVILDQKLEEPMELALLPDGNVLFIERRGNVKIYDQELKKTEVIATIPVNTKYRNKEGRESEAEDGLLGVILDPGFEKNHWIYFYYSAAGTEPKNILTRYELHGKKLDEALKKIILEVPVQREQCCHTGGSMAFDNEGNLYLSTGDNSNPHATGYSPIDERPERSPWDAQKSAANTNDLRGKILRIRPEPDGTYTIPKGNLFPQGTAKTRAEIYAMGMRNPFRISVDKKTGYLYWGDVGPDAGKDSVGHGPKAYDEINQARKPGFFGWPYFVGDNKAYYKRDFATNQYSALFDAEKPTNTSPNNTGMTDLPPAQKAFIWYPYDNSAEFPITGKGGRTAMAGPVFYAADFTKAQRAFPDYYDGKLFIYEWMRGWIMAVTMDEEGNYVAMEHFMPNHKFSNPMDMEFSKDGDLYLLEYGTAWFQGNDDARLVRIEYTEGNRKPVVQVASDKTKGAVPMTVNFSSAGTLDHDRDELNYEWAIVAKNDKKLATLKDEHPVYTFNEAGTYTVNLTVKDPKGEQSTAAIEIQAGNEPPELTFEIVRGNNTFFFPGQSFDYDVKVNDKEDGSLESGAIQPDEISVSISYLKEGFDKVAVAQGHLAADASAAFAKGKNLIAESDCKACHIIDKKSIGPTYRQIAQKYKKDPNAVNRLSDKIINGGSGVWGETAMAAHPQLSKNDVAEMVKYILSLSNDQESTSLPPKGSYTPPKESIPQGACILRAAYTDKGSGSIGPITSDKVIVLRSPVVIASSAEEWRGIMKYKTADPPVDVVIGTENNAYIGFRQIDLTGIGKISFTAIAQEQYNAAGGIMEVHIGSPTGQLVGRSQAVTPKKGDTPVPQIITASISPVTGLQDVYFVFKNDKATSQMLFVLHNIQFTYNPTETVRLTSK